MNFLKPKSKGKYSKIFNKQYSLEGTSKVIVDHSTHFLSFLHHSIDKDSDEGRMEVGVDVSNFLASQCPVPADHK